jgi:hypothetical protein
METPQTLSRRLGPYSAAAVVIGSVIGSGIFLTPQRVAAVVQIPGIMIGVWVLTGLLTLAGALTNAEIASEIAEPGGQYVFFRVLYGDWLAFLYGWCTFIVYQTGSIAAIAVAFARYFGYFVRLPHLSTALEAWKLPLIGDIAPLADIGVKMVAIGAIVTVAAVNYTGVQRGGLLQVIFTSLKVAAIAAIIVLGFAAGTGSVSHFFPLWGTPSSGDLLGAVGIAMVATLWSYDGWNSLTYLAGEVKDPQRNIPRALILGTIAVICIYVLTNLAYLYVSADRGDGTVEAGRGGHDGEGVFRIRWDVHLGSGDDIDVRDSERDVDDHRAGLFRHGEGQDVFQSDGGGPSEVPHTRPVACRAGGVGVTADAHRDVRSDIYIRDIRRVDFLRARGRGNIHHAAQVPFRQPRLPRPRISGGADPVRRRRDLVCHQHAREAVIGFPRGTAPPAGRAAVLFLLEAGRDYLKISVTGTTVISSVVSFTGKTAISLSSL